MQVPLARRTLVHERTRSLLAVAGITVALTLCFLQLGLLASLDGAATQATDDLRYDLVLRSPDYTFLPQSGSFPRSRLYQALAHEDVVQANPFYAGFSQWLDEEAGTQCSIYVLAVDPAANLYADPEIERQRDVLARPDTFLMDRSSHAAFGPLEPGRRVRIGGRNLTLGGTYHLGRGMIDLGMLLVSDQNFRRLFPGRSLDEVTLGLLGLRDGAEPERVAEELAAFLPADVTVATRARYHAEEATYWSSTTPTGLIFGSGVLVGMVVAVVILYQVLSNLIAKYLPQLATLKALGYSDLFLTRFVLAESMLLVSAAFVVAFVGALGLYDRLRSLSPLPVHMSAQRVAFVAAFAVLVAVGAALLSVRGAHRADPADLF